MEKDIEQLMNQLNETYIEQQDLGEYALDALEFKRIQNRVITRYKRGGVKKKKRIKIKQVLLIAAIMIVSSTSIWGNGLGNFFEQIFKENAKNLGDSGKIIEMAVEKQHIKIKVDGVIGNEKELALVYEVEKTDGIPFEGNTLDITGYVELEGNGEKAKYFIDTCLVKEIRKESTPTKRVFLSELSNREDNKVGFTDGAGNFEVKDYGQVSDFTGKKVKLVITSVIEKYSGKDEPDVPVMKMLDLEAEKDKLPLDSKKYEMGSHTGDEKGTHFIKYSNYQESEKSHQIEDYYVYDIKDAEELKQYKFSAYISQEIRTIEDEWVFSFDSNLKNHKKTIMTEQTLPTCQNDIEWEVKKIELSNISLEISLKSIDLLTGKPKPHSYEDNCQVSEKIKLILKNGTQIEYSGHGYGTWVWTPGYENQLLEPDFGINIFLVHAIDPSEVVYIEIGGVKIPV